MASATEPASNNSAKDIDAVPAPGQLIDHDGKTFTTIKEGRAHILAPAHVMTQLDTKKAQKKEIDPSSRQTVFYNPIQQFNRDLSVLAIRAYSEDLIAVRQFRNRAFRARQAEKKRAKKAQTSDHHAANENGHETLPNPPEESHDADIVMSNAEPIPDEEDNPTTSVEDSGARKRTADDAFPDEPSGPNASKTQEAEETDEAPASSAREATNGVDQQRSRPKSEFRILDALSASGLRALRYAAEIPAVTSVVGNDLSHDAVEAMRMNVKHNKLEDKIQPNEANAMAHMYQFVGSMERDKYDVIDLDPYGTAAPFVDSALHALKSGGLLCVTCTDAGVWASCGYPEKTYALYGGTPIRGYYSHEGGLRLILNLVATAAAKQELSIEPLLSMSIDFYARCFIRVRRAPIEVKHLASKTMLAYICDSGCQSWQVQPLASASTIENKKGEAGYKFSLAQGPAGQPHCEHCGFKTHVAGPMWAGPLHNPHFCQRILDYVPTLDQDVYGTTARIEGMLTTVLEETSILPDLSAAKSTAENEARPIPPMNVVAIDKAPFFIIPSNLASVLHCQAPGEAPMKGALRHAGFKAVRSHMKPGSIKTNAPMSFIWHMMREWIKQKSPIKEGAVKERSAGAGILGLHQQRDQNGDASVETPAKQEGEDDAKAGAQRKLPEVVFDTALGKEVQTRRYVRFQQPPPNWGPMMRAKK